jgi:hypothetical protein
VLLLGVVLTIDLARANAPWIQHLDYRLQYASNPIIDILRKNPWLHRVAVFPPGMVQQQQAAQQIATANQIWRGPYWLQRLCPYYNIQSLDIPQDPRAGAEKTNYLARLPSKRLWELTNTRYILGLAGPFADILNQSLDPERRGFRMHTAFTYKQNPENNIGAETNTTGPWALIEFTGALPRAKLYTRWLVTNYNDVALETLASPAFDPHSVVLVHEAVPAPATAGSNAAPGSVEFASYAPKHIELKANATAPSILLLNDQYDRDWSVTVNGKPVPLLRCNYLMRGVQVPAGASDVVFHFQPSLTGMKLTLAAFGFGVLLCVLLVVSKPRSQEEATPLAADAKKQRS